MWEHFSNYTNNVNANGTESLPENGTAATPPAFPLDLTVLFVQAFHGNQYQTKEVDKSIKEVVDSWEHDGMRYDKQIIMVLEPNDPAVNEAAKDLYNKHQSKSAVVVWDEKTGEFKSLKGGFPKLTKYSRVQVVGHGREQNGKMEIGGRTGPELADIIAKLSRTGDEAIWKISLIGCNIAKTTISDPMPLGDEPFLNEFMNELKSKHWLQTEVSARNTFVQVNAEGRKMVAAMTPDGMKWHTKDPSKKVILRFDEDGNIISTMVPATKKIASYPGVDRALGFRDIKTDQEVEPIYLKVGEGGNSKIVTMDNTEMDRVLNKLTENTFKKSKQDMVKDAMLQNQDKVRERLKLKKNEDVRTIEFDIVEPVDGNVVKIARKVGKKSYTMELNIGASVQNTYVYESRKEVWVREVRIINSVEEMVREINWLGLNGIRNKGKDNLYRFGDWVIKLGKKNFYAEFHGVVASEELAANGIIDTQVTGNDLNILKKRKWPFKTDKPPADTKKVSYAALQAGLEKNSKQCMEEWYQHKGDHSRLSELKPGYKTALLTFAISISEPIRNFRTHFVNIMALEMFDPLWEGTSLTMKSFLENHPMAQGGTWVERDKTGFHGLHDKNERKVRPKELAFTRQWLLGLGEDKSNPHGQIKAYDATGPMSVEGEEISNAKQHEIIDSFAIRDFNQIAAKEGDGLDGRDASSHPGGEEMPDEQRGPLGDIEKIVDKADSMKKRSKSLDIKSLSLRTMNAVAADHAFLTEKVANIVRRKSLPANFKLDTDSVKVEDDEIRFSMVNEENPAEQEELCEEIDKKELQMHDNLDEINDHVTELADPVHDGMHQASKILGVYGIISGLGGALNAFEEGDTTDSFIGMSQSIYQIGDMNGWNEKASKAAGKAFANIFKDEVKDLKSIIGDKLGSKIEQGLSKTAGKMGDLMEDVPFIGIAFGVYGVVEDFKQHNTLGYIDAGLDIAMVGVSMLGPEAEPVVIALTMVRLMIGDFYNDIKGALDALPKDASSLEKFDAFMKGFALALKDIFEQFTLIGQIVGAIEHSKELDKHYNEDREKLKQLADYDNYFKVEKQGDVKVVNFADGTSSWNGGDITFQLHDDATATLTMEENVDEDGNQRTITTTIHVGEATGIITGIGESHSISFKTQTVKVFFFIPVDKKRIISGMNGDRNSLHGTYYGNSKDNQFFTVQHLPEDNKLDYTLGDYFYELYGMDGNDIFYLGPQKTHIHGGEGSDTYMLQEYGGHTHIDNYAIDMKNDMLVLNSTDFEMLSCSRESNHLYISNSGYSHHVKVVNWFLGERYQHLNFLADKGVFFEVRAAAFGIPRLIAIAIDCTKDVSGRSIDTRKSPWRNIVTIHGSNYTDTIVGNDQDNRLNGGNGTDMLTGSNGKDMYIVDIYDTGNDVINNCADDKQMDTLMIGFQFLSTIGWKNSLNLKLNNTKSKRFIEITNWFRGPDCQHMTYVSTDGVAFKASTNMGLENTIPLTAYLIDKEGMTSGQRIDIVNIPKFSTVVTVVGSNYSDTILGNKLDNYISGGLGDDIITGGEGADTYVMRPGHGYDTIINLSFDRKLDMLLFGFNFSDVSLQREENDLIINSKYKHSAKLKDWFMSKFHQHLVIRTIDDVVSILPQRSSDSLVLTPVVVDKSKSKTGVQINSNINPFETVQRLIGSNHSDVLTGNNAINYLDPKIGGSKLMGGNNSDTYIMSVGYSTDNIINNFATDGKTDVLSFEAHYSDLILKGEDGDLVLSCVNHTAVTLANYKEGANYQHLFIQSGDGVGFTLEPKNNTQLFDPVPHAINRGRSLSHQKIDLRSHWNWTEVNSVIGSSRAANYLQGQDRDNTLIGGSKSDSLKGDAGNDVLRGGDGENFLDGGLGNDTLIGGNDTDWMLGWLGDDILYGGYGADRIDGGPGSDTVLFSGNPFNRTGVYVDLHYGQGYQADAEGDIYIRVENIYGSPYNDILIGNAEDNILFGQAGNDIIQPGNGTDLLIGAEGRDVYILGGTTGAKTIQNKANDSAEDTLTLLSTLQEQLQIDRYGDHLLVKIGEKYSGYWCPEGKTGPIIIQNWFANETNRHLSILCNDTRLNETALDNAAGFFTEPSSMNTFVCSVIDFGMWKAVLIGLGCLIILVALITVIILRHKGESRCSANKPEEKRSILDPVSVSFSLQRGDHVQI